MPSASASLVALSVGRIDSGISVETVGVMVLLAEVVRVVMPKAGIRLFACTGAGDKEANARTLATRRDLTPMLSV